MNPTSKEPDTRNELSQTLTRNGCLGGGVELEIATERGRAEARAMVGRMLQRGVCSKPPEPPPQSIHPGPKHHPRNGWSSTGHKLVAHGLALPEPFRRVDLMKLAKVNAEKASNAMTAWRKLGWIVASGDSVRSGWVRTSGFRKATL